MLRRAAPLPLTLAALVLVLAPGCDGDNDEDDPPAMEGEEFGEGEGGEELGEGETDEDMTEPRGERPEFGHACAETPVPTGIGYDKVVPNVVGIDQWGEELSLYDDLCDKTVVLVRAGMDCGECNTKAPIYGELERKYRDQGLAVLTLLHDYTQEVGVDQLNIWANVYELDHPIVVDQDFETSDPLWPDDIGRPKVKVVAPGAVVIQIDPEPEDIEALFE